MIRCDYEDCDRDADRYRIAEPRLVTTDARASTDYAEIDLCSEHAGNLMGAIWEVVTRFRRPPAPASVPPVLESAMKTPSPEKAKGRWRR
jgi:hypothetical protein